MRDKISARTHSTKQSVTITDEELLKLTSLFTEQKVSSDLPPEPLQGNPQRTNCSDPSLATTNCHSTAVLPKWGFISKESHRQKDKDNSHIVEKTPKERIPGFLNSRTHPPPILSLTPDHIHCQYHHISTCPTADSSPQTKKGLTNCWNGSLWTCRMKGTTCQEHPGDSWGATPSLRCHSFLLMPTEKPEHTPQTSPHGTKGLIPQIFDIFSGKMMIGKVENCYVQPRKICQSPVTHKGFFTCLTFREDTGGGCQQLPDSDKHN